MKDPFERREEELVNMVNSGEMSEKEYREEMRDLRMAYEEERQEAAQQVYDEYPGW